MSLNAEYNFSDWYRPVDNGLTADVQELRIKSIKELINLEDKSFWLDVIRLSLNIPLNNIKNREKFIKSFKDVDPIFPVSGNEYQLKVLARILLCFRLEKSSLLNNFISLALLNINFLGQYEDTSPIPLFDRAKIHLSNDSVNIRNFGLEVGTDIINELEEQMSEDDSEYEKKEHDVILNAVSTLLFSQQALSEEINILWWLFGESSLIFQDQLKSIGFPKIIAIIPKELFDLLKFELGPLKINSIIQKGLSLGVTGKVQKNYSPFDLINKLEKSERQLILGSFEATTIFTPVLSGLSKSMLFEKGTDWAGLYTQEFNGGDIKKQFSPALLAMQIFNELLLLNRMN